jgi:hypothetical protein
MSRRPPLPRIVNGLDPIVLEDPAQAGRTELVFFTLSSLLADTYRTRDLPVGRRVRILDHGGFSLLSVSSGEHHVAASGARFVVDAPEARPEYFGADTTGVAVSTTAMNAMIGWVNGTGPRVIRCTGAIRAGNLTALTRSNVTIVAWGCQFTKAAGPAMWDIQGADPIILGLMVDGAGFPNATWRISGARARVLFSDGFNTLGQGISIPEDTDSPLFIGCAAWDTGSSGIAAGKTNYGRFALCSVRNTGAEGMPGDQMYRGLFLGNLGNDCGGVGAFGTDLALQTAWGFNIARNAKSAKGDGIRIVDHRGPSKSLLLLGNILAGNPGYGIRVKNDYRKCNVTAITRANPGVVTFASIAISAITRANPARVTATGHGKVTGDLVKIANVGGMTQVNGNTYKVVVVDSNNLDLYDEIRFREAPINSTAFGIYTSGGQVNHAFANGDRVYARSIGGMTGIIGIELLAASVTNTTMTLTDVNDVNYDTSGFSAFTSGGFFEAGGYGQEIAMMANILDGNTDGNLLIEDPLPGTVDQKHTIMGNQLAPGTEHLPSSSPGTVMDRQIAFLTQLGSGGANATGDGTEHRVLFNGPAYNIGAFYANGTGLATMPRSGFYKFEAKAAIQGMTAAATDATIQIRLRDPAGVVIANFLDVINPKAGDDTQGQWWGDVSCPPYYLLAGSTAEVVITVAGLAAGAVQVRANGDTWFHGRAV